VWWGRLCRRLCAAGGCARAILVRGGVSGVNISSYHRCRVMYWALETCTNTRKEPRTDTGGKPHTNTGREPCTNPGREHGGGDEDEMLYLERRIQLRYIETRSDTY